MGWNEINPSIAPSRPPTGLFLDFARSSERSASSESTIPAGQLPTPLTGRENDAATTSGTRRASLHKAKSNRLYLKRGVQTPASGGFDIHEDDPYHGLS